MTDTTTPPEVNRPTPHPSLQSLDRLIGTWNLSDPQGAIGISGQVRFEWMDGNFFMQQHMMMVQGGKTVKGIEIIGYDETSQTLKSHYFDSEGSILEYTWECDEDTLTIWFGDVGSPARYVGHFSEDGNVNSGGWEWPGGGYTSMMTRVQ